MNSYLLATEKSLLIEWYPRFGNVVYYVIHDGLLIVGLIGLILLLIWTMVFQTINFKKFAFIGLALIISLSLLTLLIEFGLALHKFKPGYSQSFNWFVKVDKLETYKGFEADSMGITRYPQEAVAYNKEMMDSAILKGSSNCCPLSDSLYTETYETWKYYYDIMEGNVSNSFSKIYYDILQKETWTAFDSLIVQYVKTPINKEGYKSIPFTANIPGKKKILLLGDSFTFGHHVDNISSGFGDILLSDGFLVYNTGISGADIMQYYLIAQKYIPVIQPNIVIMNCYLGNDLSIYPRQTKPFLPIYYTTNAGNLYTNIEGVNYTDPDSIYQKILSEIKVNPSSFLGKIVCKTRIGTLLWAKLHPKPQKNSQFNSNSSRFYFVDEIKKVEDLCKQFNSAFYLASIPECINLRLIKAEAYPTFFNNFEYHEPANLSVLDYVRNNGHFNEEGHMKYSEFLEELIKD